MMLAHKTSSKQQTSPNHRNPLQFPRDAFLKQSTTVVGVNGVVAAAAAAAAVTASESDRNNNATVADNIVNQLRAQAHQRASTVEFDPSPPPPSAAHHHHRLCIRYLKCNRPGCDRLLRTRDDLIVHLRNAHNIDRPFRCFAPTCKDSFLSETKLVEHSRDFHRSEKGWIPCTKCLTSFTDVALLKVHILICHYDGMLDESNDSNSCSPTSSSTSSPDGREYMCEFANCGERFQTRQLLERHQKYHFGLKPHRARGHWAEFKNNGTSTDIQQNDPSQYGASSPLDSPQLAGKKRFYPADEDTVSNDSNYGIEQELCLNLSNDNSSFGAFSKPNSPDSKCSQEIVTPMTSDDDDDDDESFYADYSEADLLGAKLSDDAALRWCLNLPQRKSRLQFFWQYNSHSKRLKDQHRNLLEENSFEDENPYVFNEISDPVFSESGTSAKFRYNGKIRKCDGNDWTPNPKKLLMIGLELKKLTDLINALNVKSPMSDMSSIRKEKNKLTSRICRLKKKAQNEANKIKLYGLYMEHRKLLKTCSEMRKFLEFSQELIKPHMAVQPMNINIDDSTHHIDFPTQVPSLFETISNRLMPKVNVSGETTNFVNYTLDGVATGKSDGGMNDV